MVTEVLSTQPVGDLHHLEPAVGAGLLFRDAIADFLDEDLSAPARDRVEPAATSSRMTCSIGTFRSGRRKVHLRGREPVDVDRMCRLM